MIRILQILPVQWLENMDMRFLAIFIDWELTLFMCSSVCETGTSENCIKVYHRWECILTRVGQLVVMFSNILTPVELLPALASCLRFLSTACQAKYILEIMFQVKIRKSIAIIRFNIKMPQAKWNWFSEFHFSVKRFFPPQIDIIWLRIFSSTPIYLRALFCLLRIHIFQREIIHVTPTCNRPL